MAGEAVLHLARMDRDAVPCQPQRIGHRHVVDAGDIVLVLLKDGKDAERGGVVVRPQQHGRRADFVTVAEDGDDAGFEVDGDDQRAIGHAFVVPVPFAVLDRPVDGQDALDDEGGIELLFLRLRLGFLTLLQNRFGLDRGVLRRCFGCAAHEQARGHAGRYQQGQHQQRRTANPFHDRVHGGLYARNSAENPADAGRRPYARRGRARG